MQKKTDINWLCARLRSIALDIFYAVRIHSQHDVILHALLHTCTPTHFQSWNKFKIDFKIGNFSLNYQSAWYKETPLISIFTIIFYTGIFTEICNAVYMQCRSSKWNVACIYWIEFRILTIFEIEKRNKILKWNMGVVLYTINFNV